MIANLEALRLRLVSIKNFIEIKKLRTSIKKWITEINKKPLKNLTPTSYEASIRNADMEICKFCEVGCNRLDLV